MENIFEKYKRLVHYCADKLCKKYDCNSFKYDLVSVGYLVIAEKQKDFDTAASASFSTYIYPFLISSMKREIEKLLFPMHIPKDEFKNKYGLLKTNFVSTESIREDTVSTLDVAKQVMKKIYIECVKEEVDKLTYKEKQIIGGFYDVFGYEKQTVADLAEEFQLKENALQKAKDNAVEKLSFGCFTGKLDAYRKAVSKIKKAKRNIPR